jgi:hypothetical protein
MSVGELNRCECLLADAAPVADRWHRTLNRDLNAPAERLVHMARQVHGQNRHAGVALQLLEEVIDLDIREPVVRVELSDRLPNSVSASSKRRSPPRVRLLGIVVGPASPSPRCTC